MGNNEIGKKKVFVRTFGCPTLVSRALRSALALGHAKSLKRGINLYET